jgi:hypothetical protein
VAFSAAVLPAGEHAKTEEDEKEYREQLGIEPS